jgi:hypothetical protein
MELVRATTKDRSSKPSDLLNLASPTLEKVTRMVSAHSYYLLGFRARKREVKILTEWLASPQAQVLSEAVRKKLDDLR